MSSPSTSSMQPIMESVKHELVKLVPESMISNIACFVLYDNHPKQVAHCDITICTKERELKEYYKREEVGSISLDCTVTPTKMRILRNSSCHLFYLLASANEVSIVSNKDELKIHLTLRNIDYYDVDDFGHRGIAYLKIVLKDDAVPLIFDDKFESLRDTATLMNAINVSDSMPILEKLKRKLTQAQYNIKCNEKTHKELKDLRKLTAFATYQKLNPNLDDSLFRDSSNKAYEALKLKTRTPIFCVCHQKAVIILNVINKNREVLTDVSVLLHVKNKPSMVYVTKLFQRTTVSPFWQELPKAELKPEVETAIALVVDLTELQYNVMRRIEFLGVISYKRSGKECLMPFDRVLIPYSQVIGKNYDVLSQSEVDEQGILAILATSQKIDVSLRMLMSDNEVELPLPMLFSMYAGMQQFKILDNAVIHRSSPYHELHGVMAVFEEHNVLTNMINVGLYVRSPHQVLALIHTLQDSFPFRMIVTARNQKVTTTVDGLRIFNEELPPSYPVDLCYMDYALSISKQITIILEYFDSCMRKMNASTNAEIKDKVGKEIDMFAGGLSEFKDFRTKLLREALRGVLSLDSKSGPVVDEVDVE